MQKASKVIENYGTVLNLDGAENYLFCGALAKTMQRIGRQDFDYWFFSGVTGDTFTQVFSRNFNKYYDCLSSAVFAKAHLDSIFNAIGYNYELVNNAEFHQATESHIAKVKQWINKDVPVIVKDTADSWYSLAVGYDNDTILQFNMLGEELQTYKFDLSDDSNYALVFVGDKAHEIDMANVYKNAVLSVPALLNKASTDEVSFGKQAFVDWADSLLAGRSEFVGDYFDWAGTNAHMDIVLDRALALNPDLNPMVDKLMVFAKMQSKLFPFSGEAKQALAENDKAKLESISAKIRELADYCDEVVGRQPPQSML
jgi:hypothetical protein